MEDGDIWSAPEEVSTSRYGADVILLIESRPERRRRRLQRGLTLVVGSLQRSEGKD